MTYESPQSPSLTLKSTKKTCDDLFVASESGAKSLIDVESNKSSSAGCVSSVQIKMLRKFTDDIKRLAKRLGDHEFGTRTFLSQLQMISDKLKASKIDQRIKQQYLRAIDGYIQQLLYLSSPSQTSTRVSQKPAKRIGQGIELVQKWNVSQASLIGGTETVGNETFKESPCSTEYKPAVMKFFNERKNPAISRTARNKNRTKLDKLTEASTDSPFLDDVSSEACRMRRQAEIEKRRKVRYNLKQSMKRENDFDHDTNDNESHLNQTKETERNLLRGKFRGNSSLLAPKRKILLSNKESTDEQVSSSAESVLGYTFKRPPPMTWFLALFVIALAAILLPAFYTSFLKAPFDDCAQANRICAQNGDCCFSICRNTNNM